MKRLALGILLLAAVAWPAGAGPPKPKVVSLDSCADQLILALAEDSQILALSPDARGPFSYFRERAQGFPVHDGTAEAILLARPDLVLGTGAGDGKLKGMLERLGIPVVATGLAENLDEALSQLEAAGRVLGNAEEAARLVAKTIEMRRALEQKTGENPSGLYISPSGITTGSGTFLHETLELAGLANLMAEEGVKGWSRFDLETFLATGPEVVITSFFDSRIGYAESWRFAAHPAVQKRLQRAIVIDVPSRYLSCPAWYAVEGAALIRKRLDEEKEALRP